MSTSLGQAADDRTPSHHRASARARGETSLFARRSLALPVGLTALLLVAALAAAAPISILGDQTIVARLHRPLLYVALAPFSDVLDAMSLLSLPQHIALVTTVLVAHGIRRWRVRADRGRSGVTHRAELRSGAALLAAIVVTYAIGLVAPRPMAALRLLDADALAIDFHSHTDASHDGRPGFTAARNRAWHAAAGFDAAYLSDHATLSAMTAARASNPLRAGAGTVLLPGTEIWCQGQHLVVLGARASDVMSECTPTLLAEAGQGAPGAGPSDRPVLLLAVTKRLWTRPTLPRVQAIEIADAAPRALDEIERHRALLSRIQRRGALAAVAGSNNHGWGATSAAWSVMRIPGWRALTPAALDVAIRRRIHRDGPRAVSVVERTRVVVNGSTLRIVATVPLLAWCIVTTLTPLERAVWVAWTWLAWRLVPVARGRLALSAADARRAGGAASSRGTRRRGARRRGARRSAA